MRTKILLSLICLTFFYTNLLFATDRVVQHNGPAGTYGTISAAIAAANDGDNIVINNRQDGLPWQENISINKSLTLVSAVDNVRWWMEGDVTIALAAGRTVTIVGLRNTLASAYVLHSGSAPMNSTNLNILNSDIAGAILVNASNFYLGSSKVGSQVQFTFGKIIGNEIRILTCNNSNNPTEDVNMIIGNKMGSWSASGSGFEHNSTSQYLFFSNNLVCGFSAANAAYIAALKSGTGSNRIVNNNFISSSTGSSPTATFALSVAHTSGQLALENNIICGNTASGTTGSNAVKISSAASPLTNCTYNLYYNNYSGGTTLSSSLNNVSSSLARYDNVNTATGNLISGTLHINTGNMSNAYLDLDLTRNDIGMYGGSYSMENFLPYITGSESSRVNYVNTPRIVGQGGTINVQAIGFDK